MVRHVAGIAEVVEDIEAAARFYRDVLGLEVEYDGAAGYGTVKIAGILHFGLWSRETAAGSIFGDPSATARVPLGFTVGFEVDDVAAAETAMSGSGCTMLQSTHKEDWGQVTARFLTPSGALAEVSETPWARTVDQGPTNGQA